MKVLKRVILSLFVALLLLCGIGFILYKVNPDGVMYFLVKIMPGNDSKYEPAQMERDESSPLNGKQIIFLGSSVTQGAASCGNSFVEYLEAGYGVVPVKEAVGGTTLVTVDDTSYIPRMKTIDKSIPAGAFLCQLSTNDASKNMPLGEVSDSRNMDDFDTSTVAGAIEYIIAYAQETWKCPVLFYTNPRYDSPAYAEMVSLLQKISEKWNINVVDLWNNETFNAALAGHEKLWMSDSIHPTMAGYRDWWTPEMKACLEKYLSE